ncbi:interleukin-18-binding protein [Perognathus longimembris pacificus]|uniref:interleukin-18-binding protein n=1 Tax=Perognathus longimembris pacificus TaxID=214514 RepID=UPI002019E9AC|nr:interleukin-18-binding protein [Perognathus longimembris pacificus]
MSQLLTSMTVLSPDPTLWALLLCAHTIPVLAQATSTPLTTTAASALPVLQTAQGCPALEVTWPETEVPLNGSLTLSCTACSRFPHFSILYWLGNGSFIEHLPGPMSEGHTSRQRQPRGASTRLQKDLVLEELSPTLRSTNFSCVFVDPGRVAQRHIVLAQLWTRRRTVPAASQGPRLPTSATAQP